MDDTRTCTTTTCENQRSGHCYLGEDLSECRARKPAPVDPVSGLTPNPKFTLPELPDGAVLIVRGEYAVSNQCHWLPDGRVVSHTSDAISSNYLTSATAAAHALNLPLAGEDLAEGEEAWTTGRLSVCYVNNPYPGYRCYLPPDGTSETKTHEVVRPWKYGWIIKRIPAQAKPAPAFCRRWGQCVLLAKAEAQPCCGCADHEPDQPEPESVEARLERAGANPVDRQDRVDYSGCRWATIRVDGKVNLKLHGLPPDRAEAALLASQGKKCAGCTLLQSREDAIGLLTEQICKLEADVDEGDQCCAAKDTEIEGLKDKLALQEIYHAEAVYHIKSVEWLYHASEDGEGFFCPECGESRNDGHRDNCKMGNWLARNKTKQ